jgi:hypothetical protein
LSRQDSECSGVLILVELGLDQHVQDAFHAASSV